ncbi:MAG TPA: sialidase family protein [Actinomycetota bacterium]|nr:sialidase family protein [Actinomycetota bacterium]
MLRRLATVLVIVASIGVVAPAARAAPTVVDVSRRTTNQSEAAVAASPLHPNDVAIASNLQHGFGVLVSVSHDGGATWAHEVLGDADAFGRACCDPTIAWDRFGDLFVSWLGYGKLRYPTVVPVLLSTDAGDTWSLLTRIKPPAAVRRRPTIGVRAPLASARGPKDGEEDRGPGFLDQPTITTGANSLWAIWNNEGQMQAVGAPIRGLGDVAPFKPVHDVPGGHNCTFGDVAVGPGGAVAEICQKDQDRLHPVRSIFRLTVDKDGLHPGHFADYHVVAQTDVSLFEPIRPQRVRTVDAEVGLAWIRTGPYRGRIVMMFTVENPDESDNTDVYVKTSDDGGNTWSRRIAVTTAPRSQFLPRMAMDTASGHLVVGWHDARLDDGDGAYDTDGRSNTDAMYAVSFSADGGRSWSARQTVSDRASNAKASGNGIDFGDYTGIAFAFGVAHPAWADNSNSTGDNPDGTLHAFDVYSASVPET